MPINKKLYILDTSVLIHDPRSLFSFQGAHIGIPITVLEELDKFKTESTDRGAATRAAIRALDGLRQIGSLQHGVPIDQDTTIRVLFLPEQACPPSPLKLDVADNEILMTALAMQSEGYEVTFISKDINARVKADVLGIEAQDYIKDEVSTDTIFKGWIEYEVPSIQFKRDMPEILRELLEKNQLEPNEFILLTSKNNPQNYRIYRYRASTHTFVLVNKPELKWPLEPRNPQQLMALNLLLDPSIPFVTLIGPAGTGKTFLALLAGLDQVLIKETYRKMLISRPVIPLGPDIGYLPGTVEEKLRSWMQPMYDNMEFIVHIARQHQHAYLATAQERYHQPEEYETGRRRKKKKSKSKEGNGNGQNGTLIENLDGLIKEGRVSLEAITYMRGRSIPYQYILIDEVQNLTPHEVKTLLSRVGEGSKVILAGDPYQIDAPYLDFSSNGLVVAANRFRGQEIFGTVFLESSERSELSKLASSLL
jgi:PhoH-like ATPase